MLGVLHCTPDGYGFGHCLGITCQDAVSSGVTGNCVQTNKRLSDEVFKVKGDLNV